MVWTQVVLCIGICWISEILLFLLVSSAPLSAGRFGMVIILFAEIRFAANCSGVCWKFNFDKRFVNFEIDQNFLTDFGCQLVML